MTVDSKMTAIADEIRILSGTTDSMGLDLMASHVGDANNNIDIESDLILQITDALNNKAGGTSLNFEVVGNPQPSNAKENTIWVNTETKVTGYHFSATQPESMQPGEVWFRTGINSPAEFNVVKNNSINVYPTSAQQYINGQMTSVEAKTYIDNEWQDWGILLVPNPIQYDAFAWASSGATITANAENTTFVFTTVISGAVRAVMKVNTAGYTKLKIEGTISNKSSSTSSVPVYVGLFSGVPTYSDDKFITGYYKDKVYDSANAIIADEYDISNAGDDVYFGMLITQGSASKTHTTTITLTTTYIS